MRTARLQYVHSIGSRYRQRLFAKLQLNLFRTCGVVNNMFGKNTVRQIHIRSSRLIFLEHCALVLVYSCDGGSDILLNVRGVDYYYVT